MNGERGVSGEHRPAVHPTVVRLAAYSWRLLVIAAAGLAVLFLVGKLWVIVVASVIALFVARMVAPVRGALRHRGWRPLPATAATLGGFALVLAGAVALIVPPIAEQFGELGPILTDAADDVETWIVEDSPFDVSRADVEDLRKQAGMRISDLATSSGPAVASGALVAFEALAALLLGLISAFFLVKDGDRFGAWLLGRFPVEHRPLVARMGARAWKTLGGYLRGAAALGAVEGSVIAIALTLAGGELAVPVAVLTFVAAFIPFAGAIAAGLVAVAVALVTAGPGGAAIVAVVALAVQQIDNDILAPLVYGKSLELHPVVILFSLAAGSALFGTAGAVLAVPVTAVLVNVMAEAHRSPEPSPAGPPGNPAS